MPISQLVTIEITGGRTYQALKFWCPGCETHLDEDGAPHGGAHMLPISGDTADRPVWAFDGDEDAPTLSPSILTRRDYVTRIVDGEVTELRPFVCHSFIRGGRIEFLSDCTHPLAGQTVPLPEMPGWFAEV